MSRANRLSGGASMSVVVAVSTLLASCGGSGSTHRTAARPAPARRAAPSFAGLTLRPPQPEPPLALSDYLGRPINIAGYRGKVVLVTFLYTHCPDTCPLIAANLHNALAKLGPSAARVQLIAVSTDPRGDTSATVRSFVARHELTGRMEYLIGSRPALRRVWHEWHVDASNPTADDQVGHSALVYGIAASGRVMTVYPANFTPAEIAHDVPLLFSR